MTWVDDGAPADEEPVRDLLIGLAVGHQAQHLDLTRRQDRVDRAGDRWPSARPRCPRGCERLRDRLLQGQGAAGVPGFGMRRIDGRRTGAPESAAVGPVSDVVPDSSRGADRPEPPRGARGLAPRGGRVGHASRLRSMPKRSPTARRRTSDSRTNASPVDLPWSRTSQPRAPRVIAMPDAHPTPRYKANASSRSGTARAASPACAAPTRRKRKTRRLPRGQAQRPKGRQRVHHGRLGDVEVPAHLVEHAEKESGPGDAERIAVAGVPAPGTPLPTARRARRRVGTRPRGRPRPTPSRGRLAARPDRWPTPDPTSGAPRPGRHTLCQYHHNPAARLSPSSASPASMLHASAARRLPNSASNRSSQATSSGPQIRDSTCSTNRTNATACARWVAVSSPLAASRSIPNSRTVSSIR